MRSRERARPSTESERIVVDEIFDDGTARVLRAKRKPDCPDDDFRIDAWENEDEEIIETKPMELLLADELSGRDLGEGDVFLVSSGETFFEKQLPKAKELAVKVEAESRSVIKKMLSKRSPKDIPSLLQPLTESKRLARREIKLRFNKLVVTRGIKEKEARKKLMGRAEEAMQNRLKMENPRKDDK